MEISGQKALRNLCIIFCLSIHILYIMSRMMMCQIGTPTIKQQSDYHLHYVSSELELSNVKLVNCRKLIEGNEEEHMLALKLMKANPKQFFSDEKLNNLAQNCTNLRGLGYKNEIGSQEEENFPIAFSILLHRDLHQMERLLRIIYSPQNYYCLHVDRKAHPILLTGVNSIAKCFPNIVVVSKQENVVYASFSRLQAELNCMTDLVHISNKWTYVINLVSSVLPLRTNREMVQILKLYNGSNDIEGRSKVHESRISNVFIVINDSIHKTSVKKEPPPHNIQIVKGSAYGIFSRQFVEYVLKDKRVRDFLEWCKDTFSPDEHFWATLNSLHKNPHLQTPGGFKGRVADMLVAC